MDKFVNYDESKCTIKIAAQLHKIIMKVHSFEKAKYGDIILFTVSCDESDRE